MNLIQKTLHIFIATAIFSSPIFAASVSFDLSKTGGTLQPKNLTGTCLPIWNSAQTYKTIKKGLETSNYRLFRFPNGSLSNGYHWNGSGAYGADSAWVSDSVAYKPGFMGMTRYRGTSVNSYGFVGYSNITDGDTSTFWRSDELISGSAPYFYLELPRSTLVDSIVIVWGDRYAVDFDVDFFNNAAPYPGPFKYSDDFWQNQKHVTGNDSHVFVSSLPSAAVWYVRVLVNGFKTGEHCVEVKEAYLYAQGKLITSHSKKYSGANAPGEQTRVIAMPTSEASLVRPDYATGWVNWDFETYINYIHSLSDSAVPVICVNYGTGTPQEAAAWVHYANKVKNYNIRFWQIGNEMDGEWEEGGPVKAIMYAEKYLRFAKAMKQADSTIKVFGPVLSNADFNVKNSGSYDGKSWLQSFLEVVGAQEKADNTKYCDGVDFHTYPYYSTSANSAELMRKIDYVYDQSDSIASWIKASLLGPDSIFVMMSEYNSSVVMSDVLQRSSNGIFVANLFAGLADKFGSRAMSVFWDSYEALSAGPNGTYGALSLFTPSKGYSSLSMAPSAAFWGLYCAENLWIDPKKKNNVVPASFSRTDNIRAYGVKTDSDFRGLVMNVTFVPETLSCNITGATYSRVDVFTWGETQFKWTGSGANVYAFPNCGPTSYSAAIGDVKKIVLPPQSLTIIRYHDIDTNDAAPKFLQSACLNINLLNAQPIVVCGSVYGGTNVITGIDYAVDSAKNFAGSLKSMDGAFDGPFESFYDSIPTNGYDGGLHTLYIRARCGDLSVLDSIRFGKTGIVRSIAPIGNFVENRSVNRIQLTVNAKTHPFLKAQVFGLNGTCVKDISCVEKTGNVLVQWSGETAGNKKVASGVYLVVLKSAGRVIYKSPMVIGRN